MHASVVTLRSNYVFIADRCGYAGINPTVAGKRRLNTALADKTMDIAKLRELAKVHRDIDYESKASIKSGNAAAEAISRLISESVANGEATEVVKLLSDHELGTWVAYSAGVLSSLTEDQRVQCVSRIKEISLADGLEATAAKLWLKQQGHVS